MKVRLGVIGCSNRIRAILKGLLKYDPEVEVVALCDPDETKTSQFKELFSPGAKVFAAHEELIDDDNVDSVVIGPWNALHASQTIAAMKAGKRIFVEKPLATTFEDCLALKMAHLESPSKLMIGFTLRYSPHFRKIQELVASGAIGKTVSFEFNETVNFNHGGHIMACWRRKREFTGCHILEKCCHDIDVANWIVGSRVSRVASFGGLNFFTPENEHRMRDLAPSDEGHLAYCEWPSARGKNPFTSDKDIIDNQVCIFEYANGVRATFHTNINAGIPERRTYILGTEGAIRADSRVGKIELCKIGFGEEIKDCGTGARGGHAGGDNVLTNHWSKMLHEDVPSLTGVQTGIESAVVSLAADEAMLKGQVVDLGEYWAQLDAVSNDG